MNPIASLKKIFTSGKSWFIKASLLQKVIVIMCAGLLIWFGRSLVIKNSSQQPQYQTAQAEKTTLIESVTVAGSVSNSNSVSVGTQVSGIVSQVYAKNGDSIEAGQPIAKLTLDQEGQQKQAQAYSSYLSAKNNVDAAQTSAYSLQSDMFSKWDIFQQIAQNSVYTNSDGSTNEVNRALPEFHIAQDNWLAAEAKYKNQQAVITQTQVALNAAWLSYQQSSDTITAPISGVVSGLTVQNGTILTSSSSTTGSNTTTSSTKIASVKSDEAPTVAVNLTEIDVPKVKIGDKATLTFDAFPDKTFTGRVTTIDTEGSVSSGVTSYPAIITLDAPPQNLYPNMSASAAIITNTKDDVVTVPNAAVQTQDDQSTVRVLKNGSIEQRTVETGLSNDINTEITSGLNEGETVVVGQSSTTSGTGQTTSPFGGTGGIRTGGSGFGGGGNTFRIAR